MLITTAEDSYNIFRPNLDPDSDEEDGQEEGGLNTIIEDESETNASLNEESKTSTSDAGRQKNSKKATQGAQYYVDSDEEDD